jgi:hypothetical protein
VSGRRIGMMHWEDVRPIYVLKQSEFFVKTSGCSFMRVAILSPEELEELLLGEYYIAATKEAAEWIKENLGVEPPMRLQGCPPALQGDKVILLGPNGQAVDITLVF